jgi:hypothetical protein
VHLAEVEHGHDQDSAQNISGGHDREPPEVCASGDLSSEHAAEDLAGTRDAVREPSGTDHEGEQLGHRELARCVMAGGDHPRDQRDQPSADHGRPKKMRPGLLSGFLS